VNISVRLQPFDAAGALDTIGNRLTTELDSPNYNRFLAAVAYVASSGTSRLFRHIREFTQRGGAARVYVGLGNGITSRQATTHLLDAGASIYGFDTEGTVLFHPKVYLLTGSAVAWISIGSSNLTSEGLYRNFEVNTVIELTPTVAAEGALLQSVEAIFQRLHAFGANCIGITRDSVESLVATGRLIDENAVQTPQRISVPRTASAGRAAAVIGIRVPAAPPPDPSLPGVRRRTPLVAAPAPAPVPTGAGAPAPIAQYFAMTMSAFDSSHRSGVPGTPEVSLPEDVVDFFPPTSLQGRQYPDAYFGVLLNKADGTAERVRIRIWQRPPGSATGHADWRLNVSHNVVDLTTEGGGDILLFEKLPEGSDPPYEMWIVRQGTPEYQALLQRCTRSVQSTGTAGTKRYGIF